MNSKKKPVGKSESTKPKRMTTSVARPQSKFPIAGIRASAWELEALRESEKNILLFQAILQSTSDGILAVNRENEVLFANERFVEMWRIPQEIMASNDDNLLLQYVLDQLYDPQDFLKKVHELYNSAEESFDTLYFKDGKVFERLSRPMLQGMELRGRVWSFRDITGRKRAEQALEEESIRRQILFEQSPDGILIIDPRTARFLDFNAAAHQQLGYSREEFSQLSIIDVEVKETADETHERIKNVLRDGKADFETIQRTRQGEIRNVHVTAQIVNVQNHPVYYCIWRDITERKQAEETIRESEKRLHQALEAAKGGTWEWDLQTNANRWSEELWRVYGLEPYSCEPSYEVWLQTIHPDDRAGTEQAVQEAAQNGTELNAEWRVLDRDSTERWLMSRGKPIRNAEGQITRYIGTVLDITDRKRSEGALRESENRFRSLFENMLNGFAYCKMLFDHERPQDFIYLDVNHAFERLTGLKNVIGKKVSEAIPGIRESDAQLFEIYGRVALTGIPETFEIYVEALKMWFSVSVYSPQKEYFVAVFDVITERKQAEQALREYNTRLEAEVNARTRELHAAQEKLMRQERLAMLGQLAGSIGHELRNPLGVISNAIYYLKLVEPDASDEVREYLGIVENETRIAEKIITDLLDFSRLNSLDRQAEDVTGLAQRTLERFPVPESIHVSLNIPSGLPLVFVDLHQIMQVLGNLVVNACQAMPEGGSLIISSQLSTNDGLEFVVMRVQDTGVGIPLENMDKLFEPLFTTKTHGIGLGLAVSRKLVEANGGRIEVESEPGKGSTFTVWLPTYSYLKNGEKQ